MKGGLLMGAYIAVIGRPENGTDCIRYVENVITGFNCHIAERRIFIVTICRSYGSSARNKKKNSKKKRPESNRVAVMNTLWHIPPYDIKYLFAPRVEIT